MKSLVHIKTLRVAVLSKSYSKLAEFLGVSRAALSKSNSGIIKGFMVVDHTPGTWYLGYTLSEHEAHALGIPSALLEEPKRVCLGCGVEHSYTPNLFHKPTSNYCNICLGTHEYILGSIVKVSNTIAVTDGTTVYESISQAAQGNKTMSSAIAKVIHGERKHYKGVVWTPVKGD